MPGLPFENLPAQQNPTGILENRYREAERYMRDQYDSELGALKNKTLADKDFFNQLNDLNSKYSGALNQERFKSEQQLQSIRRIQDLVRSGKIAPDAGDEAMWRVALPVEAERAMFQTAKQGTPFSVSQITSKSMMSSIEDFAEAATEKGGMEWGPPKKLQQGLMDQYVEWRALIGYNAMNPLRQRQLDMQWDAFMAGDERYDAWWSNKQGRKPIVEVNAMRSKGKVGKIMRDRIAGVSGVTPLGDSIARKKATRSWRMGKFTHPLRSGPMPEEYAAKRGVEPTQLSRPTTQAEYDRVPSGTDYIGTDGQKRTKR